MMPKQDQSGEGTSHAPKLRLPLSKSRSKGQKRRSREWKKKRDIGKAKKAEFEGRRRREFVKVRSASLPRANGTLPSSFRLCGYWVGKCFVRY